MDSRERILRLASQKFQQYGFRNVTMDDLARQLGISKKTVYQAFANKSALVSQVVAFYFDEEKKFYAQMLAHTKNAVDELVHIAKCMLESHKNIAPNLGYELRRYFPEAWEGFVKHKNEFILPTVKTNLIKGVKEGLFRPELDVEIVSRMRIAQIESVILLDVFPPDQFREQDVHMSMFRVYMYGIVTEKGRKLLENYLQQDATFPSFWESLG